MEVREFWAARAAAAVEPREVTHHSVGIETSVATYELLEFASLDGAPIFARCITPKAEGKHPCVLVFHDIDRGPRGWHHLTRFLALGYCVVELERRSWVGDVLAGWQDGPEALTLTRLIEDALVCASVARTLPAVDPERMIAWGEGLGGALALDVAALAEGSLAKVAALNPMPADFRHAWELGASQLVFAGLVRHFREDDPTAEHSDAYFDVLHYVDTAVLAGFISESTEALMGTSLMDEAALPQTQGTVYDHIPCNKNFVAYPKFGHERINDFENKLLKFCHF